MSAPIRLSWWHWYEIFISFDMGELIVNGGAPLWEVETTAPVGYVREAVDLSPFAGNPSVTIDFRLFATSVVNRTGWYVDDVLIEYCEETPDARFLVTKDFNDDNTAEVEVTLSCNTGLPLEQTIGISEGDPVNFVVGDFEQGTLDFFGNPDSDCQGLVLFPGTGASCTIFNTRLFEGIPTLSQYGLAVLALMMLGVGLIGFRRLV